MGGGLMQLVAYGAQDIYLTGNPQITFFKVVYRRHTNFAMEVIEQTLSGASTAAAGSGTCTISRNGDLVGKVYVTSSSNLITDGDALVDQVDLEIGGQLIDRHYKEWMQIWSELSTSESKALGRKAMCGAIGSSGSTGVGMVQVPLQFWFCRNPGLALPLIALQYHEVKLKLTWGAAANVTSDASAAACKVMVDYIYLDTDERRRFAQVSHEYLIEQVQRQQDTAAGSMKLNFNHPVKELVWTGTDYTNARLTLNGHDRIAAQEEEYFQLRQTFDHHTAVPRQNLPISAQVSTGSGVFANSVAGITQLTPHATTTVAGDATHFAMANTTSLELTDANVTALGLAVGTGSKGQTLALLPTTVGTANQYTGGAPTLGTLYVATVHSVGAANTTHNGIAPGAGAQVIQLNASGFVDASSAAATFPTAITTGAADGRFALYRLNPDNISEARTSKLTEKVNVYSFALNPEEHQPSGTCNFSRIDAAHLKFEGTPTMVGGATTMNIYAVNYNVLRIMSGMGGLAYSN